MKKTLAEAKRVIDPNQSNKTAFLEWLSAQEGLVMSAKAIVASLDEGSYYAVDHGVLKTAVWYIDNEQEVRIAYAALILQHISIYYTSTARSMFNFIKNDEGEDVKAFQWFIDRYDFSSQNPYVTIDMLWNFFYETGSQKLANGIREVLSCYTPKLDKELL